VEPVGRRRQHCHGDNSDDRNASSGVWSSCRHRTLAYSHRSPHVGRLPAVVTLRCTLRRILHLSPGCRCIRHPTHRAPCRPMTYTRSPAPRTRTCYPLIIVDISIFLHALIVAPISLNNSHSDVFAQSSKARISKRIPVPFCRLIVFVILTFQ